MGALRIATFRVDVTPPIGSPLCKGGVAPVREVADPLYAIGAILLGDDAPVLLCAVDWCEINDEAHLAWRRDLARALDTDPDRVALHAVHQHNAPAVDLEAQRSIDEAAGLGPTMDVAHFHSCVAATAEAARAACQRGRPVNRVAFGSAVVKEVASTRRILGDDGKVRLMRWASAPEPEIRAEPEGTIDPLLRTVAFLDGHGAVACLHFYATHPMSYYGDGVVTSDFAGLAREQRCAETPGCEHIYFNGCAGDIAPGKYNDGTPESRVKLTGRIHKAIVESERQMRTESLRRPRWDSIAMLLPARRDLSSEGLQAVIRDAGRSEGDRKAAAQRLAYLRRIEVPTRASRLRIGRADILFLPGEPFIEYQLFAAEQRDFVAVAGYGDIGPGYIALERSYEEGGYEITDTSVSEGAEAIMRDAIRRLLSD